MPLPTLKSASYKYAKKSLKDKTYAVKRLTLLLKRVMTRIEKITIYLGEEDLNDKELKTKISLLSQLIGVKKQVMLEIKELEGKTQKTSSNLSDILR
jgi:hypothetical protein